MSQSKGLENTLAKKILFSSKAECDNCFNKVCNDIKRDRKQLDSQIRTIENKLNNSMIELEYQKGKKNFEECK